MCDEVVTPAIPAANIFVGAPVPIRIKPPEPEPPGPAASEDKGGSGATLSNVIF